MNENAADMPEQSLNCFIGHTPLATAPVPKSGNGASGARLPLDGMTLAVKDNIDLQGLPTTAGCPALADSIAATTAPALQRLITAGATVYGKANMHELAFGVTSRNRAFGFVRNPHNRALTAGGSSGGSAAAVAAGQVSAALGTDTGGSIRVPAAFCGVVGFRPSWGRYSSEGVVPLAVSRDTIGPIARCVEDVARLDRCISGDGPLPDVPLRSLTLGLPQGFLLEDLDPSVERAWLGTLDRLKAAGATLRQCDVPGLFEAIDACTMAITAYELRRDLPTHILARSRYRDAQEFVAQIASPDVQEIFRHIVLTSNGPTAAHYEQIQRELRPRLRQLIANVFAAHRLDAWILPAVPVPPFSLELERELTLNGKTVPLFMTTVRNLQQATIAGLPSLSLPMPVGPIDLPCGLCVEGLPGSDRNLLAIAQAIESALG